MASQTVTESKAAKAVHHSRIQEVMFDDFFGKKLPHEGFTIEEFAHKYFIVTNPASRRRHTGKRRGELIKQECTIRKEID